MDRRVFYTIMFSLCAGVAILDIILACASHDSMSTFFWIVAAYVETYLAIYWFTK